MLRTRPGSLLIEALIAIAVFAIFLGGIGIALVLGERSTIIAGDRSRAAFLAEQQLEAVRQMRTVDFDSVTTGNHGLELTAAGWSFSGTLVKSNGFTTWISVTSKGTDWMEVGSHVIWNFGNTRSGSVVLSTQLTNWRKAATVGNWAAMSRISNQSISGSPEFQSIAVNGSYAYATSDQASQARLILARRHMAWPLPAIVCISQRMMRRKKYRSTTFQRRARSQPETW
jgi:Tfp pilus assembly protein PilV